MINGYETTESQSMNLIEKLDEFDKKYVKIMNQTQILNCKYENIDYQAIIEDEALILNKLKQLTYQNLTNSNTLKK